jgi:hypothetical protein
VVGTVEELSEVDKKDMMVGFIKKVALDAFSTETLTYPESRTDVFEMDNEFT